MHNTLSSSYRFQQPSIKRCQNFQNFHLSGFSVICEEVYKYRWGLYHCEVTHREWALSFQGAKYGPKLLPYRTLSKRRGVVEGSWSPSGLRQFVASEEQLEASHPLKENKRDRSMRIQQVRIPKCHPCYGKCFLRTLLTQLILVSRSFTFL